MGIVLALLSAVIGTGKDLCSKRLAFELSGAQSAFASFSYAIPYYLVLLPIAWFFGLETFDFTLLFLGLVVLRSITDSAAEWTKMSALGEADISFISSFLSLSPLFLLLTAPIITGDTIPPAGVFAVILICLGSFFMVGGFSTRWSELPRKGVFLAIASSFFFSLNTCFDRLAVQNASALLSGFTVTLFAAFFVLPWIRNRAEMRTELEKHQKLLWLRGLLETLFMVGKLAALQYLSAQYVAALGKVSLLLAILGGRYVFQEGDFRRRFLSGLLILSGVILIVLVEVL